jgi:DNA-directed RNA polymerase subunit RPC12/RpoP
MRMSRELDLLKLVKTGSIKTTDIEDITELTKKAKLEELEMIRLERLLEEERRRLEELKGALKPKNDGNPTVGLSLALANPKVVETLKNMSDEELMKLMLILSVASSSGNSQNILPLILPMMLSKEKQNTPTIPQSQSGNQITLEGLAALIKSIAEVMSNKNPQENPSQMFKEVAETIKTITELSGGNKELEKRIDQIENKIIPPDQWIEFIRKNAELLGLKPGSSDSEVEKLRIELEKWKTEKELEMRKWLFEQQQDAKRIDTIMRLFEGPIGKVVDKVSTVAVSKLQSNPNAPQEIVTCPNCGGTFKVPVGTTEVICPYCGEILRRVEVKPNEQSTTKQSE